MMTPDPSQLRASSKPKPSKLEKKGVAKCEAVHVHSNAKSVGIIPIVCYPTNGHGNKPAPLPKSSLWRQGVWPI
jgi:hypothetical protein